MTTTETAVSAFSAVSVEGDVQVDLVVGSASKVEVYADSALASSVVVGVSQGTLSITFHPSCEDVDEDPQVTVTSPSLPTAISATQDAEFEFPGGSGRRRHGTAATVGSMSLTASSDAKIKLKQVQVTGTLDITTSADGDVDTQNTVSPLTVVPASSDSQVQGGSTTDLQVTISGDSQVKYYVTGTASGSVTPDSKLKLKVQDGPPPSSLSCSAITGGGRCELD